MLNIRNLPRWLCVATSVIIGGVGCTTTPVTAQQLPSYVVAEFGQPPAVPEGPISAALAADIQTAFGDNLEQSSWGPVEVAALERIVDAGDPRLVWVISDMMRFTWREAHDNDLAAAAEALLGITINTHRRWGAVTDHLIAWDIPSYPGYLQHKRAIFTNFIPGWDRIFVEGDIDWRLVSWGGVLIDARPYDRTHQACNCIPAADNPQVSAADEATWLDDDDIVFGIEVNGEYRAYPRQIMEVREMVNDTLGGRDLGIPYCTLCGAAQAYFTDQLPAGVERPVLRTTGLLIRSNKVMYDITTHSVFDTFLGRAVTGPLAEIGLQLEQATVVTTDWGTWRRTHPETTVLVESLALGRDFDFRNGRDANGPIFPVGDVDPRLDVHDDVIGVITASGQPIAFERRAALLALRQGQEIAFENVRLELDAGGIRAVDVDGSDLGSHEAFWFAWSQFHPGTELWTL
ncbi:DUF3179 domain-containing (seleno)protein [Pontivivens insulae]|uniref:DUF3179 domain-containing protein n=1 Tax=Pontivivens insulae TaxID=1639689 RepID=A0A2R8A830_9RHOB|nr:DUF3179 domain-containing (seleno)protein [Pontivivens insulae]RED18458.1 uncharacterized protein DUF3179 [Pontivivens insulae]SPF28356.1 hypothetical protein POI8812_00654 [Pontivivens insulae]